MTRWCGDHPGQSLNIHAGWCFYWNWNDVYCIIMRTQAGVYEKRAKGIERQISNKNKVGQIARDAGRA